MIAGEWLPGASALLFRETSRHSHRMAALALTPTCAVPTQDPAYIQELEIPLSSKDHSNPQDVDLFACSGLEPHGSANVGSQVFIQA
ncbi:hypothetical protein MC885_000931, partial [Smutsia gigantea]